MLNKNLVSTRIYAQILDTLIYLLLLVIINFPMLIILRILNIEEANVNLFAIQIIAFLLIFITVQTWQIYKYGATFGYHLMKLKIVHEDGSKLNLSDSLIRVLLRLVFYALSASTVLVIYHYIRVISTQGFKDPLDEIMHTNIEEI